MTPTISVVFSQDTFIVRKNYEGSAEYIALPKELAVLVFDGTRTVIKDTRTREEYVINFYKARIDAGEIFQYLLGDIYGMEGLPPFPNTVGRTLFAAIEVPTAAATVSLQVRVSENYSNSFDLYTQTGEQIGSALNSFLEGLGLAGLFTVGISSFSAGQRLGVTVSCSDCWAENMMLAIDNGGESFSEEFILD